MKNQKYSIGELAALAGVSRRTVRFYVQRGLIPAPEGAGRGSYYTREHLDLIGRIRSLQGRSLTLDRIVAACPAPESPLEKSLVTRIALAGGVALEFAPGSAIPPDNVLRRMARFLAGFPGMPDEEVDDS